jgi:adenosine deaminase
MKNRPKLELHLHLEGAASPAFIKGLAAEKKLDISGIFDERGNYAYADFAGFLDVYEAATQALKTPEDYARLTTAVLQDCAEHGVVYAETFLSTDFCGGRDVGAWREYLAAIQEAAAAMEPQITLRGCVTAIRHFGPERSRETAICAAETAGDFITGFGIAGAETVGAPRDFAWAFDCAREAGLGLTAHAGEWGGATMVRDTLDQLPGISRIGHGVQAITDLALCDRLIENDITLEVCPGSNVALGVVPNWAAHPIEKLRARGVKVTVSTDDPPFFHTTMTNEYDRLAHHFGWEDEIFREVEQNALEAAFCSAETRAIIAKRLQS